MIEIVSATALSSVQDLGRDGYLRYGVGTSGAMDRVALAAGNILLGNPENSAAIEIPFFPNLKIACGHFRSGRADAEDKVVR